MTQVLKPKHSPISCLTLIIFDPLFDHFPTGTNQWGPLPDMTGIRSDFSAVTYGSSVFAIGGCDGTNMLGGVEQFEEGVWSHCFALANPRAGHRFISTLDATVNSFGYVQLRRLQRQGLRSGRPWGRLHYAALSGVLHPRTSWHQA